jgi:hypothetical protein
MITALKKVISEKMANEPEFQFAPANTYEELQRLHSEYCTEAIEFEEVKGENKPPKKDTEQEIEDKIADLNKGDEDEALKDFIDPFDPFNRQEPKVRDYVLDDEWDENKNKDTGKKSFAEPTSRDDSFQIPSGEDSKDLPEKRGKAEKEKKEPINPAFDEMDGAKKRKNTKMFARFIVEGVCSLAEHGFVWYANRDINEAKLVEYEINNEMDLNILITLDANQQATVKDWFGSMCVESTTLAKIDQDSRDELSQALTDVLLEKGIAPTPTQMLLMVAGKVFLIDKGLALLQLKMKTNSVLDQLRIMHMNNQQQYEQQQQQRYASDEKNKNSDNVVKQETKVEDKNTDSESSNTDLVKTDGE